MSWYILAKGCDVFQMVDFHLVLLTLSALSNGKKEQTCLPLNKISSASPCLTNVSKRIQKDPRIQSNPGLINSCAGKGERHIDPEKTKEREPCMKGANSPQAWFSFLSPPFPSHLSQPQPMDLPVPSGADASARC